MEKTKGFIETELQKYENLYWKCNGKLREKEKVIVQLQAEAYRLREELVRYNTERKRYQELYNELPN